MFQFVYWLKALAAICITNSHYADIWPIPAMAFYSRIPDFVSKAVVFLSELTLEIYLGQFLILNRFSHLPFPIDFFVVTCLILLYAWATHITVKRIMLLLKRIAR